ncbi:MAG: tellurite resistance TerB family protein [Acetobacteraceae bacterium]|nr:tellurite resistance TerB family protein [Acetobacteraceae bacterium]
MLGGGLRPPLGNAAGAAAAGGLLGSILGGGRNGGGLLRVGGMGILGMLAYRAYEQWKAQQGGAARTAPTPATGEFAQAEAPAGNGQPFGLAVIRAMIAAAKSDGTLDERERERIFGEAERLELDPAAKGLVFDALRAEPDPAAIAAAARTDAQRAELYLASAMVTQDGGATSSERAYLDALAHHLRLETGLRRTLDDQAREAAEVARSLPETR